MHPARAMLAAVEIDFRSLLTTFVILGANFDAYVKVGGWMNMVRYGGSDSANRLPMVGKMKRSHPKGLAN